MKRIRFLRYTFIILSQLDYEPLEEIRLFLENAYEMLAAADQMIGSDLYSSSCNRSYYAIVYAASALLTTKR